MTSLNIAVLASSDLVRYFSPSTYNEEVLYQALKDVEYDSEYSTSDHEKEIEELEDRIKDVESDLYNVSDERNHYQEFFLYIRSVFEEVAPEYPRFEIDSECLQDLIEDFIRKGGA